MELLKEEEIKKLLKNQVLFEIKKAKEEFQKRLNQIDNYKNSFNNDITNKFIEVSKKLIYNVDIVKDSELNLKFIRNNISVNLKLSNGNSIYNEDKKYYIEPINNMFSSNKIIKFILMGEICKHINENKFNSFIDYVNEENVKMLNNINDIDISEIKNYIEKLNYQLEKLKINEVFQEGNEFIFNYNKLVNYGKRKRYDSRYFKVLKIIGITPTMCVFKLKRNEEDKEWFKYKKERIKKIKKEDGSIIKTKEYYDTELIKKKKDYIYKFIKNKEMNLIKVQSRALKLKNILESK